MLLRMLAWLLLSALVLANARAYANSADNTTQIIIVGAAPLPGSDIDNDQVPGNVQTVSAGDILRCCRNAT